MIKRLRRERSVVSHKAATGGRGIGIEWGMSHDFSARCPKRSTLSRRAGHCVRWVAGGYGAGRFDPAACLGRRTPQRRSHRRQARVYHLNPRQLLAPGRDFPFGSGRVVAFEGRSAAFTYVLGDAAEGYGELSEGGQSSRMRRLRVLRRLLLLKPATLVIEDLIRLSKTGTPVRWWLDVVREPEIVRVQGRLGLVGPKVRFAPRERCRCDV